MVEKWQDIKGYEGLYRVSNLGRIKSIIRVNDELFDQIFQMIKSGLYQRYLNLIGKK